MPACCCTRWCPQGAAPPNLPAAPHLCERGAEVALHAAPAIHPAHVRVDVCLARLAAHGPRRTKVHHLHEVWAQGIGARPRRCAAPTSSGSLHRRCVCPSWPPRLLPFWGWHHHPPTSMGSSAGSCSASGQMMATSGSGRALEHVCCLRQHVERGAHVARPARPAVAHHDGRVGGRRDRVRALPAASQTPVPAARRQGGHGQADGTGTSGRQHGLASPQGQPPVTARTWVGMAWGMGRGI